MRSLCNVTKLNFVLFLQLGLFNQITLEQCPGLAILLDSGEKVEELMKLSPEAILLRWVNHQLERAGVPRRINNLTNDITDSEAYTHLLYQIAPLELGVTKEALMESDPLNRAEIMLQQADKLGCRLVFEPVYRYWPIFFTYISHILVFFFCKNYTKMIGSDRGNFELN